MKTQNQETQTQISPLQAIEILKNGNQRFVQNLKQQRDLLNQVNDTRDGQWPFAVILSCIDSRTSSELIFDQGLGDVFSIRIAGNVVNSDIVGSIEFACKIAKSKLILVLGHSQCGAIKGACDHVEMGNLTDLLAKIQPAIYLEKTTLQPELRTSKNLDFLKNITEINVRRAVKTIIDRSYILEQMIEKEEIAIIGANYSVETGQVTFLEDSLISNKNDIKSKMNY